MTEQHEPMVMIPRRVLSELIDRAADGCCCCGSPMNGHESAYSCGHEPVDATRHYAYRDAITDPAAMAAALGRMLGQEAAAYIKRGVDQFGDQVVCMVTFSRGGEPLYRVPQPAPDYAVASQRAADIAASACSDEINLSYCEGHNDAASEIRDAIRALMPAGVEVFESDGTISCEHVIMASERAGKRVYIVTVEDK